MAWAPAIGRRAVRFSRHGRQLDASANGWRGVLAGLVFVAASAPAAAAESMLGAMAAAIGPIEARRAMTGLATRADCTGHAARSPPRSCRTATWCASSRSRDSGRTALLVTGVAAFARAADGAPMQATSGPEAAIVHGHDLHRLLLDLEARVQVTSRRCGRRVRRGLDRRGPDHAVSPRRRLDAFTHDR